MEPEPLDDLLDRLVAEYSDRVAHGDRKDPTDLLARAPEAQRPNLERCFRMIQAGIAAAPVASATLQPGARLEQFEIVRELGRGGMSVVYLARQLDLRRPVALKVLRPGLALERRHVDRFRREALAVARLQHPHIVQVHAVGESLGHHWLAMEFVEGRTLADVYAEIAKLDAPTGADLARLTGFACAGRTFEQALCALLVPVVRALGVAHELGLVHRDVKPSNILVHKDGRAVIADFGLAKGDGDPGLSLSGEPLGTPYYMSPEQATLITERVDQRSDVYSFGVTLFEGLTGRRPFEGANVFAVLERLQNEPAPSVREFSPEFSRAIDAVVRRAMSKAPSARYPTALEFAVDLQAVAEGRVPQALAQERRPLFRGKQLYLVIDLDKEYKSSRTLFGLPLVHIVPSRESGPPRTAKAWLAYGPRALGVVAIGNFARGVFAFGGAAIGVFTFGGLSLGALSVGGLAAGLLAFGGVAVGHTSIGGFAAGQYGFGGNAVATYAIDAERRDPEAVEWFQRMRPALDVLPVPDVLVRILDEPSPR